MARKSLMTTADLAGSLAVGLIGGSVGLNAVVSARQAQPSASATASASAATAQATPPAAAKANLQTLFLDQLSSALNIQRSALDSAISSAGVSTVDAAVQQGTLTQEQGDALKARIQAGELGALWGGRGGPRGAAHLPGITQAMLEAAAQTLGITADELRTELRDGQTLAQLAQAHNTTEQAVIDAALAAAKTQLDQAVAAGTLTQAQADAAYAELQAQGSSLLSGGHRGGHDDREDAPQTPQPSPSASATT